VTVDPDLRAARCAAGVGCGGAEFDPVREHRGDQAPEALCRPADQRQFGARERKTGRRRGDPERSPYPFAEHQGAAACEVFSILASSDTDAVSAGASRDET
jgi:hypothetical protein